MADKEKESLQAIFFFSFQLDQSTNICGKSALLRQRHSRWQSSILIFHSCCCSSLINITGEATFDSLSGFHGTEQRRLDKMCGYLYRRCLGDEWKTGR